MLEHGELQVLARAEVGEEAGFRHAGRLRQAADRQALKTQLACDPERLVEDGDAGLLALGRRRDRCHGTGK